MCGTRIENLKLLKVVDGDTIKVELNNESESLRLLALDTEESNRGSSKPVTNAGKLASQWAKRFFDCDEDGFPRSDVRVTIEFDTQDSVEDSLKRHRGNYGRLLCYVLKENENYNITAVKAGWSPYFVKYGRSRLYHEQFLQAESEAMAAIKGVWDESINSTGLTRDYQQLLPWWYMRGNLVNDYRKFGIPAGVISVRLDYQKILDAAENNQQITVFCDLQGGINRRTGNGAVIFAGSPQHKFNLWIADRFSEQGLKIINLVEKRYTGINRGYVYVTGKVVFYKPGRPQIVLDSFTQFSDYPN